MTARTALWMAAVALLAAGCATKPAVELTLQEQYEPESVVIPPLTPPAESAPIDPVEPQMPEPSPPPAQPAQSSSAPSQPSRCSAICNATERCRPTT